MIRKSIMSKFNLSMSNSVEGFSKHNMDIKLL